MDRHQIFIDNPNIRFVNKAVEVLEQGGIIVYPTDTLYGIGCSIYNKQAMERLYKIKGKSKFDPMSIICNSIQQISKYVFVSNSSFRILKKCFPGPYTVILEAKHGISKLMLSRRKEIGVRIPDNKVCQMLVSELGHPILNTSVRIHDEENIEELADANERFLDSAELILDSGKPASYGESTVVRLSDNNVEILRDGLGSLKKIII